MSSLATTTTLKGSKMITLKNKTREQVETLHNRDRITTRHYNAYAKRWNTTPRFGPLMQLFPMQHPQHHHHPKGKMMDEQQYQRLAELYWKLDNNCITQEGYAELRSLEALIPPEEPDPAVYGMFADC